MSSPLRGARREIALVAGALLLPIPVLAGSGLTLPLPDAVERGIASLSPSAAGSGQVAAEKAASGVASGTTDPTARTAPFTTPAVSAGRSISAEAGAASTPAGDRSLPARVGGSSGIGDSPGGGETPTTADTPTTGDSPPDADPAPETGEAGIGQASADQGKPPLLRVTGSGHGVATGASADESGNAVVSPPAAGSDPSGVEARVSPDEQTGVTAGGPVPESGLPLP